MILTEPDHHTWRFFPQRLAILLYVFCWIHYFVCCFRSLKMRTGGNGSSVGMVSLPVLASVTSRKRRRNARNAIASIVPPPKTVDPTVRWSRWFNRYSCYMAIRLQMLSSQLPICSDHNHMIDPLYSHWIANRTATDS